MSQINLKSISGITSITTPAGVDNVFSIHKNDTTEVFRIDQSGNQNVSGIITASQFKGDGSQLTGIDATALKDSAGNVKVQAQASGAILTGILTVTTDVAIGASLNVSGILTASTIIGSGTGGIKLPVGNDGERVNTTGTLRFNSTTSLPEYYNGTSWVAIDSPPSISSISPTEVASDAGGNETFTITGTRFASGAVVKFISHTGTEILSLIHI